MAALIKDNPKFLSRTGPTGRTPDRLLWPERDFSSCGFKRINEWHGITGILLNSPVLVLNNSFTSYAWDAVESVQNHHKLENG